MKSLLLAVSILLMTACSTGPQCLKSHDESKFDYGYGYGWTYSYNPASGKTDYHWGYGYGYGYHTETICDVYASPTP